MLRATLRDLERPRDLLSFEGNSGGCSHRAFASAAGASIIGVSSSFAVAGVARVGDATSLLGDLCAGDLLSSFDSRACTGSRGTSDLGGWALRIGGSSDSERSSTGRWRDFFICSLSCNKSWSARSSSTLISSGLTDVRRVGDLDLVLLLRLLLSRPRRSLSRSGVLLRPRPPR